MAETMKNNTTDKRWELEATDTNQHYTKTLKTAGTYLDRDIKIDVTSRSGSLNIGDKTINATKSSDYDNASVSTSSTGLQTVSFTTKNIASSPSSFSSGYISGVDDFNVKTSGSFTNQLPTVVGSTITPGKTDVVIDKNKYIITNNIVVQGDTNLKPENIKAGISIFGVKGTLLQNNDTITDISDPNFVLAGYEYWDASGQSHQGNMTNFMSSNITSSSTNPISFEENTDGSYTIKMYAGSTGYAVADSTYITDVVSKSDVTMETDNFDAETDTLKIYTVKESGSIAFQISSGYKKEDATLSIEVPPTEVEIEHSSSSSIDIKKSSSLKTLDSITGLAENSDYVKIVSEASATHDANFVSQPTAGWINPEYGINFVDGETKTATKNTYIKMYKGEII